MYICFVDESGTPPKPTQMRPAAYWVLAAVIVHEAQWRNISAEFSALKSRFRINGEIKWRYFGPHNNDNENSLNHLDTDARNSFRQQMYRILTKRNSIKPAFPK